MSLYVRVCRVCMPVAYDPYVFFQYSWSCMLTRPHHRRYHQNREERVCEVMYFVRHNVHEVHHHFMVVAWMENVNADEGHRYYRYVGGSPSTGIVHVSHVKALLHIYHDCEARRGRLKCSRGRDRVIHDRDNGIWVEVI